jgi:hypothetical protein
LALDTAKKSTSANASFKLGYVTSSPMMSSYSTKALQVSRLQRDPNSSPTMRSFMSAIPLIAVASAVSLPIRTRHLLPQSIEHPFNFVNQLLPLMVTASVGPGPAPSN